MSCIRTLSLLLLALLAGAPVAAAQGTVAPPGVSALDEYVESLPTASGNAVPSTQRSTRGSAGVLSSRAESELSALGPDGRRAAELAKATASVGATVADTPDTGSRNSSGATSSETPRRIDSADVDAANRSPVVAALDAATGSGGGMGLLLPLILIGSVAAAAAVVAVRRRPAA